VIDAYNQLVFDKTPLPIRVGQIVEKAGVGRSTFYDHFASAEAVHLAALSRPLAHLAAPAAGTGEPQHLQWLLEHFWANRPRARETIAGPSRDRVTRLLADMISERVAFDGRAGIQRRLATMQLAEAMLAPIRLWILGEVAATPEALAKSLFDTAAAMRSALGLTPSTATA
jgi:AcrR family transcriptional regulator